MVQSRTSEFDIEMVKVEAAIMLGVLFQGLRNGDPEVNRLMRGRLEQGPRFEMRYEIIFICRERRRNFIIQGRVTELERLLNLPRVE